MKKKRKRTAKRRIVATERQERDEVGGTPETIAKRRDDPYVKLVELGFLDSACEAACDEIRRIRNALCYQLEPRGNRFAPHAHGVTEMPDEVAHAHNSRYAPWARETAPVSNQVIDFVTDRKKPRAGIVEIVNCIKNYARRMA